MHIQYVWAAGVKLLKNVVNQNILVAQGLTAIAFQM